MASFHAFSFKKRWFFTIKWAVSSARNADIRLKNRRFLKMIHMFVFSKKVYYADYQYFVCNAKNRRFSASKTIRRRILAVFMVRIAFLLTFFTAFMKRQEKYERNLAYAVVGTKPTLYE